jgi:hypothetical protein
LKQAGGCLYADKTMPELREKWIEEWKNTAREARRRAEIEGRSDVLAYLNLREANDFARQIGLEWLFAAFLEVAAEANRRGLQIGIEQTEPHEFQQNTATMRGARIKLTRHLRSLTVEAGFPRAPADGFIRGGGLALGRVTHFGLPKHNAELLLVKSSNPQDAPVWFAVLENNLRQEFSASHLKNHFNVFLGQI